MRRFHPPGPILAMRAANDNGTGLSLELPTPLARRGTQLCGTALDLPAAALEELRQLHAHRVRYAEALCRLVETRDRLKETLAELR